MGDVSLDGVIGVVCGLQSEKDAFGPAGNRRYGVSGARPERAETETRRLIAEGAQIILSVGLAGGLDPELEPGVLLLPDAVIEAGGARHDADPALLAELRGRLGADRRSGALYGSDALVDGVAHKARLFAGTNAAAVDMESHRAARAAAQAGLPFAMIRAVADPASRALPRTAFDAIGEDGRVRPLATAVSILKRPQDLPALIALGRESGAALAALKRAGALLAPAT